MYFLHIFFVNILEPSSCEEILFGPNTLTFFFLRKSTKSFNRKTSIEKYSHDIKPTLKNETKGSDKKIEQKKPENKKTAEKEQPKKK